MKIKELIPIKLTKEYWNQYFISVGISCLGTFLIFSVHKVPFNQLLLIGIPFNFAFLFLMSILIGLLLGEKE